jgi:hypothetical protein
LKRTPKQDLDKFEREKLKHLESHRKAFERKEVLGLFQGGVDLLVPLVCLALVLVDRSSFPLFGWNLIKLLRDLADRRRP